MPRVLNICTPTPRPPSALRPPSPQRPRRAPTPPPPGQSDSNGSYAELAKRLREISTLNGISGLLGWDEMVMMPPGAAASRGAQKEVMAGVTYDKVRAKGALIG